MRSGPGAKSVHARMSIIDRDGHVHTYVRTYVHHENRSLIQSLTLMRSAIIEVQAKLRIQFNTPDAVSAHFVH